MKKLPTKYRLTVVDGQLMFAAPSEVLRTQAKAPISEIPTPTTPTKECKQCKKGFISKNRRGVPRMYCSEKCRTAFNNKKYYVSKHPQKNTPEEVMCPQCGTKFMWERAGRGGKKKFCAAKCRETFFNARYKQERSERRAKIPPRTISCDHIAPVPAASQYIPCKECNKAFLKGRANQVFCKKACRIKFFANKYLPEKVTGTFVEKVKKALAILPPEKTLPPIPPMPEDTSASSLLSAGRTLTEVGLAEAVKDTYNIEIKDQSPRSRSFWFAILLAKSSKDLQDWRDRLEKHGLKSRPSMEKWLLFQGAASSRPSASGLKARLGI